MRNSTNDQEEKSGERAMATGTKGKKNTEKGDKIEVKDEYRE